MLARRLRRGYAAAVPSDGDLLASAALALYLLVGLAVALRRSARRRPRPYLGAPGAAARFCAEVLLWPVR
jgi:hypothetical protein